MNTTTAANVRTVTDHASAVRFLNARRAELLAQAEEAADRATIYNALGEHDLVTLWLGIGHAAMREVEKIDAARL